jgi:PPM family protein phosphatase
MTSMLSLSGVASTDVGRVREHNEDAVFLDLSQGLCILADGMGGYMAGEVASQIAIQAVRDHLGGTTDANVLGRVDPLTGLTNAAHKLRAAVIEANQRIYAEAAKKRDQDGMGTTLVVLLLYGTTACIAHVGDSRCYRVRQGKITQLTRDHSLVQEQIDAGKLTAEEAKASGYKNLVTRALGIDALTEADINEFRAMKGDIYLLCSDGLSDMVGDDLLEIELARMADAGRAATRLIAMANEHGGRDNISVCVLSVDSAPSDENAWWKKWDKNKAAGRASQAGAA